MAGYGGDFLYRLLKEDEYPLTDGIKAKKPFSDKPPGPHVRFGSRSVVGSRWISTCASEKALEKLINKKRQLLLENRPWIKDRCFRYVLIDRRKLETYAKKCDEVLDDILLEVFQDSIVRIVPDSEKTGLILDCTDSNVRNEMLTNKVQRDYAKGSEEVLVERFIPPHCCSAEKLHGTLCITINNLAEKEYVSFREWKAKYSIPLPPYTPMNSQICSIIAQMDATHISKFAANGPPLGYPCQQSNYFFGQTMQTIPCMPSFPPYYGVNTYFSGLVSAQLTVPQSKPYTQVCNHTPEINTFHI